MDRQIGALAGLHVLVVEDDRDAREILSSVLSYFGAFVTTAMTAEEALRYLRHLVADVVVADMQLPKHNGGWLLLQARRRGVTAPFLAVSGRDFEERTLTDQGFEAYLRKPIDHTRLVDTILAVARRGR